MSVQFDFFHKAPGMIEVSVEDYRRVFKITKRYIRTIGMIKLHESDDQENWNPCEEVKEMARKANNGTTN